MIEQIIDTKTEAELSIFWQEIAQHLPKTLEREALGDHKIFNAFAIAYKKIKPTLLSSYNKQLLDVAKGDMELLKTVHKVELDTIAGMSLETFVLWSQQRKRGIESPTNKQ